MSDLETRVAILETKIEDITEKVIQHEIKSEKLFEKISDTLTDIRDELQRFSLSTLTIKNQIDNLQNKANTIWQTLCYVSVTVAAVGSGLIKLFEVWVK